MKSCFDGYLTEGCKDCPDWNKNGLGCGFNYDIMLCPHFAKMYNEDAQKSGKSATETE